jgi:hypothetical protein
VLGCDAFSASNDCPKLIANLGRALTLRDAELASKRSALKASLASGKPLDPSVANDESLRNDYKYDETRAERTAEEELGLDDEYAQVGLEEITHYR